MAGLEEHHPRDRAPATGHYEQLNIFGTPTSWVVLVREGERLPARRATSRGGGRGLTAVGCWGWGSAFGNWRPLISRARLPHAPL
jgi:hypothetical protein